MRFRVCFTLLHVFFSFVQLNAQYEPGMLRLIYKDSSGEKGVTTYIYNGRKNPYKAIWELEGGSRWSINTHVFNPAGKLIEKHRAFSDSLSTDQFFKHNSNGQLIHETFSRSDGLKGEIDYLYRDSICFKAICKGLNGWFFGEIHYAYGPEGQKDSALLLVKGEHAGIITYSYDQNKRLKQEVWQFFSGYTQNFVYEYPDSDCILYRSSNIWVRPSCKSKIIREVYDYNGHGGGPSFYEYDEEGRLLKKTFVRADGLKTITEYFYLESGLLKSSVRRYNDGKTGTFSYKYDKHAQLVQRNFLGSDGEQSEEKYTYDRFERLIGGKYFNIDGWLTGTFLFEHDIYDRISSATFKGSDGMDANLTFEYNAGGDLTMVHWLFQNGTSQTYRFTYESR